MTNKSIKKNHFDFAGGKQRRPHSDFLHTFSKFTSMQNAFHPQQITPSTRSLCWPLSRCWGGQQQWQLPGRQPMPGAIWNPEPCETFRMPINRGLPVHFRTGFDGKSWKINACVHMPEWSNDVEIDSRLKFHFVMSQSKVLVHSLLAALLKPDHPRLT